jgi:pimeloyl-ACP methyl ester carboxylesterase
VAIRRVSLPSGLKVSVLDLGPLAAKGRDPLTPLVLLHGVGADKGEWVFVAPLLARSRRVVAPDLLGHGDTDKPSGAGVDYRIRLLSDVVVETLERMEGLAGPVDLLGHPLVALATSAYKARRRNRPQLLKLLAAVAAGEDSLSPADLSRIRHRTLVLWGDRDRIFPLAAGRRLAARMPDARLEILPRCGHVPPTERPLAFVRRVEAFLSGT